MVVETVDREATVFAEVWCPCLVSVNCDLDQAIAQLNCQREVHDKALVEYDVSCSFCLL